MPEFLVGSVFAFMVLLSAKPWTWRVWRLLAAKIRQQIEDFPDVDVRG